ncbi:hypothetical protein ACODNH_13550 [Haloarcula sp. NS06]|uniref:hypothetical protein n=1 Tax=unclassified Haloarcula TaxID=2624677 RepID=UPI0027D20E98|nr:hypothetical protein [Haloarcula sp. H-GB4]
MGTHTSELLGEKILSSKELVGGGEDCIINIGGNSIFVSGLGGHSGFILDFGDISGSIPCIVEPSYLLPNNKNCGASIPLFV